jgi:hypothetical protein
MRRYRGSIAPRRRIFLGCEGSSEHAYGTLLGRLARDRPNMHVHIDVVRLNPGAGDPLALIERALREIVRNERSRVPYALKALLLDCDRIGHAPERDGQIPARARGGELLLIWQQPVHEGFLLRHLLGCENLRPPKDRCLTTLQREWPAYTKPMTADKLGERIALAEIERAGGVEPDLREFLRAIDWFT